MLKASLGYKKPCFKRKKRLLFFLECHISPIPISSNIAEFKTKQFKNHIYLCISAYQLFFLVCLANISVLWHISCHSGRKGMKCLWCFEWKKWPCRVRNLKTWSPMGGTVWGGWALQEKVYHLRQAWRVHSLPLLPVYSLCFVFEVGNLISLLVSTAIPPLLW